MMDQAPEQWIKEIKIDLAGCNGCKACMNACFADVIRWDDQAKKPLVAYPEDCVWCLACECVCKEQVIDVIPHIPAPLRRSY